MECLHLIKLPSIIEIQSKEIFSDNYDRVVVVTGEEEEEELITNVPQLLIGAKRIMWSLTGGSWCPHLSCTKGAFINQIHINVRHGSCSWIC